MMRMLDDFEYFYFVIYWCFSHSMMIMALYRLIADNIETAELIVEKICWYIVGCVALPYNILENE